MTLRAIWPAAIPIFFAASFAAAPAPTQVVQARTLLAADSAHAGASLKAAIKAQIASGYHINDHHPTLEYLIPTEVKFDPSKQIAVAKVDYPKGEPTKFAFADQPLSVYQGTLLVGVLLRVAPGVPAGNYELEGKLAYQACNENACLPPASAPLKLSVKVVDRGLPSKPVNTDVFSRIGIK